MLNEMTIRLAEKLFERIQALESLSVAHSAQIANLKIQLETLKKKKRKK